MANKRKINKINNSDEIVIYGIGVYAKKFYKWYVANNKKNKVKCFLVSSTEGNPKMYEGIPVIDICEADEKIKKTVTVIATSEKYHQEICQIAKKNKIKKMIVLSEDDFQEMLNIVSKNIYICGTYYHILISLIKVMNNSELADICLIDGLENDYIIQYRLKQSKIIDSVICIDKGKVLEKPYAYKRYIGITEKKKLVRNFESRYTTEFKRYKKVFLFFDINNKMSRYLQAKKVHYELIEDCLDFYKIILPLKFKEYIDYSRSVKLIVDNFIRWKYVGCGLSKYCDSIEVNDEKDILLKTRKIKEVNRKEMFEELSEKSKAIISNIFINDVNEIEFDESILVITQPLYRDGFVPDIDIQVAIYSDIIERASLEYKKIYIKAHPRDDFDYGSAFLNVSIIDRKIPTEVLNFHNKILFDKAITINSTAIYQMDFVNKKEILGVDYIKKFMSAEEIAKVKYNL